MAVTILKPNTVQGVHGYAANDLTWVDTNRSGVRLKPVRATRESGQYLGYLAFDAMTSTGIHQHLGPAFSYFLSGGLSDYQGTAVAGQMGINLAGATHDAIAYSSTLMAAKLEAPVLYPDAEAAAGQAIHEGAQAAEIINAAPELPPDINVTVDALPWIASRISGVQRRTIFDYAPTEYDRRCIEVRLLPGATTPLLEATGDVDVFVRGGDLAAGDVRIAGGDFLVIEAGARFSLSTRYGALAFLWIGGALRDLDDGADALVPFGRRV
jgi:hypothetical protein